MTTKMMCSTAPFKERQKAVNIASLPDNCLAVVNPGLAAQWHPTKNGELTPEMVTAGSEKEVWWLLPYDDPETDKHFDFEWPAKIYNRIKGNECPFLSGKAVWRGFNDLATTHLDLAKEWHPTKNGELTPDMVTAGSRKKVWWQCRQGHAWQSQICDRSNGNGCPYCSGKKILKGFNDLATVNPELAVEWHPTKNGDLTPEMVTKASNKKVWWQCRRGHEWPAQISNRSNGNNCPYCVGKRVFKGFNDLATTDPGLAAEWHPIKNGGLTPDMVTIGRDSPVWWQCRRGHEWPATIHNRRKGSGCPYCSGKKAIKGLNDLTTINPKLASEWHPTKNGSLKPDMVLKGSEKRVWWLGKCGHEWRAMISNRTDGTGCPICKNELKTSFPEQVIYFYIQKAFPDAANRDLSLGKELDIYIPSIHVAIEYDGKYFHKSIQKDKQKNIWCKKHGIRLFRIREDGCPVIDVEDTIIRKDRGDLSLEETIVELLKQLGIQDQTVDINADRSDIYNSYIMNVKDNSFAVAYPDLSTEWHPTKNGSLRPEMVAKSSNKKIWWQCKLGHEWLAKVSERSKGYGCPYCSRHRVVKGFNDLATVNPELAAEWHPTKNGDLTPNIVAKYSNKKVWWQCKRGHEWQEIINNRSKGRGCPYCSGKRVLKGFNDLATVNPILASEWHPTKNEKLTPDNVSQGSGKKVWWKDECGHEWQAIIYNRSKGAGCPICRKQKRSPNNKKQVS